MSNDTTPRTLPVSHRNDTFTPENCGGSMAFTRDKLGLGHTDFDIYTPEGGRDQHMHFGTWQASLTSVETLTTTNETQGDTHCTMLNLVVDGRTLQISLWGVSIDTLAVAVDAAQRIETA